MDTTCIITKCVLNIQSNPYYHFFLDFFSFFTGVILFLISCYIFYLKFCSNKIFCCSPNIIKKSFFGRHFSLILENLTLSPISIKEINLIFNNKYSLNILNDRDDFLFLPPFKSVIINSKEFSYLLNGNEIIKYINTFKTSSLELETSRCKKKIVKINGKIKKGKITPLFMVTNKFNDYVYDETVKYVLTYKLEKDELKTVFINGKGKMSDFVFDKNFVPIEILESKKEVTKYFQNIFEPLKHLFAVDKLSK